MDFCQSLPVIMYDLLQRNNVKALQYVTNVTNGTNIDIDYASHNIRLTDLGNEMSAGLDPRLDFCK